MPDDIYPTTPEDQRRWVEESLASRLADLRAKVERPKPTKDTDTCSKT